MPPQPESCRSCTLACRSCSQLPCSTLALALALPPTLHGRWAQFHEQLGASERHDLSWHASAGQDAWYSQLGASAKSITRGSDSVTGLPCMQLRVSAPRVSVLAAATGSKAGQTRAVQVWPDSLRFHHAVEPSAAMAGLGLKAAQQIDPSLHIRWHSELRSLRRLSAAQQAGPPCLLGCPALQQAPVSCRLACRPSSCDCRVEQLPPAWESCVRRLPC